MPLHQTDDYDIDVLPAERTEVCLNCKQPWVTHAGWQCSSFHPIRKGEWKEKRYSRLPANRRYLTTDMDPHKGWRAPEPLVLSDDEPLALTPPTDISDWRSWAHNVIGECACGIPRTNCDYHR